MKKQSLLCRLLLILFSGSVSSQTVDHFIPLSPSTPIVISKRVHGDTTDYVYGLYGIGKYTSSPYTCIERECLEFRWSDSEIPDNATITQVEVNYSTSGTCCTFKLTKIDSWSEVKSAQWAAIGNATTLHTGLPYGIDSFNSTPLKTAIQNALASNNLKIGALSEAEGTVGSDSNLGMTLNISYTTPAAPLAITVRNDLEGLSGGNVGVAVFPAAAVPRTSPYPFTAYETNRLNLAAYDGQSINDKTYFFNDTEYGNRLSEWRKGSVLISNSASHTTLPLVASDNGKTITSYLRTTSYTTSGTMSTNETWWTPVTLSGNVTVSSSTTLTITSGTTVNLNGYYLKIDGGIVNSGTISNYSCYLKQGSAFKAYYPNSLNADISVPTGQALTCGANTALNGHYISSTGGTITINGGVYVTPNIQIKQSGTLKGLYPTLESAINASTTSQIVELFSTFLLNTDTSIPSGKTLVHKSGSTLNMNGKKVTTTSGILTVESSATLNPDVRMRASTIVKGLYPNIQSALNAQASGQNVKLAARSYTENLSMKTGSYLLGEGRTQTTLYGTVAFSNVNSAWLEKLTVQQAITIQGGNSNCIDNVGACNVIDIDNGVDHNVYETTTLYNGYIDTFGNNLTVEALTSTNSKSWGVTGYGGDVQISSGTYEHKNKAIFGNNYIDFDIDNVKFCAQSGSSDYDVYVSATSSANVAVGSGKFSKCPFPNSFYGNVTVSGSCVWCGRMSKTIADGAPDAPEEGAMNSAAVIASSPAAVEYRKVKDAYNLIRTNLHKERRADRFASVEKYAADYRKIIDSALQFVDAYPDSPEAVMILRLAAYSYRSLHQHEKIMAVAEEVIKSHPQLTAAALQVKIPYLLEVNRFDEALQAMDQVVGLAKDTEERQAALYQKAKTLLNYMKNESEALAVFNQLISLDPQSDTALLASKRVDNIKGNPKPAPQTDSEEEQLEFSVVNYPNPANPGTTIKYTLPEEGRVVVAVFNIVGRRVTELENTFMPKGSHVVYWDGRDQAGNPSATGLYFYRIQFNDKMLTNKFLLVK